MRLFVSSLSNSESKSYVNRYMGTAINGDLSPTALDQLQLFTNNTCFVKDGIAYAYYTANGQGTIDGDVDQIFLATKDMTDGLIYENWQKYNGGSGDAIPVLPPGADGDWDDRQLLIRSAFWDEEEQIFKGWYIATSWAIYRNHVGYATSTDGINWNKYGSSYIYTNDTYRYGVVMFTVYKEASGVYHAFDQGERNAEIEGSQYLTSTDGINWIEVGAPKFIGTAVRAVMGLTKIGNTYVLTCEEGYHVNKPDTSTSSIPPILAYYTSTDLVTFTRVSTAIEAIEPQETAFNGANFFEYNGKYYQSVAYFKNQWKRFDPDGAAEGFLALRWDESNVSPIDVQPSRTVIYPNYVLKYYPLYEEPETNTPLERIGNETPTVSGTLNWSYRKYVQFDGSQRFLYPSYENTLNNFSVKVNIEPYDTGILLIAKQDTWELIQNNRKLEVKLYENAVLKKHYITTDDIELPPGVYDEGTEVKVGFTFVSGVLKLAFGAGVDKTVTKTVDDAMTNISLTGQVQIGELGQTNSIRSLVLMTNPTDYQWLYEIDL